MLSKENGIMMGKIVIKTFTIGFKFTLKVTNGQVIATSAVYTTLQSTKNGAESVKKNAEDTEIEIVE